MALKPPLAPGSEFQIFSIKFDDLVKSQNFKLLSHHIVVAIMMILYMLYSKILRRTFYEFIKFLFTLLVKPWQDTSTWRRR
jgi:hypothetical protein